MTRAPRVIGITLGDPAGIGPELCLSMGQRFGSLVRILGAESGFSTRAGHPSLRGARLARAALEKSVRLLKNGEIQAVVNAPVAKKWLQKSGFPFPGQTEFYARRFGIPEDDVTMCMVGPRLRVALAGTHLSLRKAVSGLKSSSIIRAGVHLVRLLRQMGIPRPRIAVCGLNPHAGEGGLFGKEELRIVKPAVRELRQKTRLSVSGPEPADTVFRRAMLGQFDGVVALYHDQGLIPAKMLDFDHTVNVTMGLPVIRCSPDHGTAFDIAGTGKARAGSMTAAVRLAIRLVRGQR